MKRLLYLALVTLAPFERAVAGSQIQHGPPASPLSWQSAEIAKQNAELAPPQEILGVDMQASSMKSVEFHDARPYGQASQRTAWLARYESVLVPTGDPTHSASVTLTLAFDATTNDLFCAFTDPAPVWAHTARTSAQLEALATERCTFSPARYPELKSTVVEVLTAVCENVRLDLSKVGQIVIRPRYATCRLPARRVGNELTLIIHEVDDEKASAC